MISFQLIYFIMPNGLFCYPQLCSAESAVIIARSKNLNTIKTITEHPSLMTLLYQLGMILI